MSENKHVVHIKTVRVKISPEVGQQLLFSFMYDDSLNRNTELIARRSELNELSKFIVKNIFK